MMAAMGGLNLNTIERAQLLAMQQQLLQKTADVSVLAQQQQLQHSTGATCGRLAAAPSRLVWEGRRAARAHAAAHRLLVDPRPWPARLLVPTPLEARRRSRSGDAQRRARLAAPAAPAQVYPQL